ncbi:MAG TPA: hypothetical protein VL088_14440 [Pedobacter sp.]|nr:hypothetical protein [Pedobacter sp.]
MKNLSLNVIKAGLMVGTLDILAALIQFYLKTQKNPITVLNFIASGFFGKEAFSGGNTMAAFGLFFHYIIALGFTLLFFILYPKLKGFIQNKFFLGSAYGVFIWLTMQFIIVPMSRVPSMKLSVQGAITAILILIACIGIPLSIYANQSTPNPKNN